MKKVEQNIGIYIWTISILILCIIVFYFNRRLNVCFNLASILLDMFLSSILFLNLFGFLLIQLFKIFRKKNIRIRIIASLLVITFSILSFQAKNLSKNTFGKTELKASIYPDQLDICQLELLENDKYFATIGHIDWTCSFTNYFSRNCDTLILKGNPYEKSNGILANKYIKSDSTLIPVKVSIDDISRAEIMTILKK